MAHPQIPEDITQVTEAELREKLSTFIDRVAFAEDELVVTRGGQPITAVISIEGWRHSGMWRRGSWSSFLGRSG